MSALWLIAMYIGLQSAALRLEIRHDGTAVADAFVTANGALHRTNALGVVELVLPAGTIEIVVAKEGFAPASVSVELTAGDTRTVAIDLQPQETLEEHVTVAATRTDRRIEDQPMRVEVLDRDEIEEKVLMTPGDIVMMLNETGGLRVQSTSPSLGAASVRIQGMRGRYTRFLSDGLPLFGEQVGSFGLLQIPPTDLGRVEVIKGVASSQYGAGAMGGVVNLVSRRPGTSREIEALINRSTRGATDGTFWYASPLTTSWGMTLTAGVHGQERADVDDDGWADLPHYARVVVRPRVFWENRAGASFFATAGTTWEDRDGGTMPGAVVTAIAAPHVEALETRRFDGGVVGQTLIDGRFVVTARGSFTRARQNRRFGDVGEIDLHTTGFGEIAVRRAAGRHTWVAGAAVEHDRFRPLDVPRFAYTFTVPGIFAQDDVDLTPWLAVSTSGRLDVHSEFGAFVSPRVAALIRSGGWSSRLSFGTGFFAPTALTEETEAAGLSRLSIPAPLRAERGRSASFDVTRSHGAFSGTVTLFTSRVRHPIEVDRTEAFTLRNLDAPTTNKGVELLGMWRRAPFSATASYAYVDARYRPDTTTLSVPLTPKHSAGLVGMWEREEAGRVGFEWYYTGEQRLEANPFRTRSEPYMIVGALAERRIGRYRVFVNAENLGNVRQTRWDPLIRPARAVDGRWTVDAWAPIDGRTINGGVRLQF